MQLRRDVYEQYVHTLRLAYRINDPTLAWRADLVPPYERLSACSREDMVKLVSESSKERLTRVSETAADLILEDVSHRELDFGDVKIQVPLNTRQGVEWYSQSPLDNFDFTKERALGLLTGAKTVYDFGGHHGVWAAYYALNGGRDARVYSFEPSIINIEVSSLLFLMNNIHNVVTVAAAVGNKTEYGEASGGAQSGMLVDWPPNGFPVVDVMAIAWSKADFLKMDIEGFEYDLLTRHPWLFDVATNLHIELHIPHLEGRGLDYQRVMDVIPFDTFDIWEIGHGGGDLSQWPLVTRKTPLAGFCSLMMRRKGEGGPSTAVDAGV